MDEKTPHELFAERPTSVGTTLKSVAPNVAEALGHTPLDFLFVDRQHGSPVSEGLEHVVRAADVGGIPVLVRVPRDDLSMVTYTLDIGAAGVMLPQVEDLEFVRDAVRDVRYSAGRSIATTARAADFGARDREEYIEYVDEDVAFVPQIESVAGVEIADELTAMDAVDTVALGPGDLSRSLGVEPGSEAVDDAVEEVFEAAEANDCGVGTFGGDDELERYGGRASFFVYGSDVSLLMSTFDERLG